MIGSPAIHSWHSVLGKFPYSRKADSGSRCAQGAAGVRAVRLTDPKAACGLCRSLCARRRYRSDPGSRQQFVTGHLRFVNGSMSRLSSNGRLGGDRFCCRRRFRDPSDCRGPVGCRRPGGDVVDFGARGGHAGGFGQRMNRNLRRPYIRFLPVAIFPNPASSQVPAFRPNRNPFSGLRFPGVVRPTPRSDAQPTGGGHRAQT